MRYPFLIVDVFTNTPFGGNQLAVITDARGLSVEGMQAVAREFDYPETTFVFPPVSPVNTKSVRIFTPNRELAFAGHPTVGTACALVMVGECGVGEFAIEEGVGPVTVFVRKEPGSFSARLRLSRAPEAPSVTPAVADMSAVLSIQASDILNVFCAGIGVNFTFVQVRNRDAVDQSHVDQETWRRILSGQWGPQVFVFAGKLADGEELYTRMYAPGLGIPEDPATGSAAAALAGTACRSSFLHDAGKMELRIIQGVAMGRPSFLTASASVTRGELNYIDVEGGCVFVADGTISVPDRFLLPT